MVENARKSKETLGKGSSVCAIFTDLSKKFDKLNYDLLISKLEACGFTAQSIVNCHFSLRKETFSGLPKGSTLGPFLFNIYSIDISFFLDEEFLSSYEDIYCSKRTTSLTHLLLRKILHIYKNGSRIILWS